MRATPRILPARSWPTYTTISDAYSTNVPRGEARGKAPAATTALGMNNFVKNDLFAQANAFTEMVIIAMLAAAQAIVVKLAYRSG